MDVLLAEVGPAQSIMVGAIGTVLGATPRRRRNIAFPYGGVRMRR